MTALRQRIHRYQWQQVNLPRPLGINFRYISSNHPGGNRIIIAYGRDAADVALASIFGPFTCTTLQVTVAIATETENG